MNSKIKNVIKTAMDESHTHDEDNKRYDLMFGDYNIFILCTYKSHPPVRHKSPNETNEWFEI